MREEKTISAQNTFTTAMKIRNRFNATISGLSDSTVTLQQSPNGGTTWYDAASWNASTDNGVHEGYVGKKSNSLWKIGVKTGDYGTDTIYVALEC